LQRDEAQQVAAGDDADQWGELFEGNCQLPLHRFLDCQLVVPAKVLDEGVSGHPMGWTQPDRSAEGSQSDSCGAAMRAGFK
jgi:hypothetical protein